MNSIQEYWNKVASVEATLPESGSVLITSLENGTTIEVSRQNAAQHIARTGASMRLATDDEVAAYWADQKRRVDEYELAELRKKQAVRVEFDTEGMIQKAVAAGMAMQAESHGRKRSEKHQEG